MTEKLDLEMRDHDLFEFVEDDADDIGTVESQDEKWNVLIVDDDRDVHVTTKFAIGSTPIVGRLLNFVSAYSVKECLEQLRARSDFAVILLDVVMETEDAGLKVISQIRGDLGMTNVRIILRTGQPGYAPELETISHYDINDYTAKNELTRTRLFAALTTAIRCYDQLMRLELHRTGLAKIIQATNDLLQQQGLPQFAAGLIVQLANFIGVMPEGLVCTKRCGSGSQNGDDFEVLTAAGRFRRFARMPVSMLDDESIRETLYTALERRESQFSTSSACIYFSSRHDRVYCVFLESERPIGEFDRSQLDLFCKNISICGHNIELLSQLDGAAYYDSALDMPNRNGFLRYLAQQGQSKMNSPVIALIDIDRFAVVNDMLGHSFGDQILKSLARRVYQELSGNCFVARVSGDVFAVYGEQRTLCAERLLEITQSSVTAESGEQVSVTTCIGIAPIDGEEETSEGYLKNAHIALKRAKSLGVGKCAEFTREMQTSARSHAILLNDLQHDFKANRLFLVFQPQVDINTRRPLGAEALLRWKKENGSLIPPDMFIPIAETSGMILELGEWVLHQAVAVQRELWNLGYKNLRMSINVSSLQFHHPGFVRVISDLVSTYGIDPAQIELEITESVGALGSDVVSEKIQRIKESGFSVAIDDFGTGFSSLSYLNRLNADRLKIDRSFVVNMNLSNPAESVAGFISRLGNSLDMCVLAEGIDEPAQAEALRAVGCSEAQGFYYSRPLMKDEYFAWLRRHHRA